MTRFPIAFPVLSLICWTASADQPGSGTTPSANSQNIEMSVTEAASMLTPNENYSFGRTQVKKMLEDRIQMAAYPAGENGLKMITERDAIFIWLANQFSSQPDCMILWNPDSPISTQADHSPPSKTSIGFIRIGSVYLDGPYRGNYVPFEQLWFEATYECISVHMVEEWDELYEQARTRAIKRNEFILAAARLEFEAMKRTWHYYGTVWLPWAKSVGFQSDPRYWRVNSKESFDEWIASYRGNAYPETPYGNYYDGLSGASRPGNYGKELPIPSASPSASP
jgi:hypothetical protein